MWKKLRWLLILLSAALNVAFVSIWAIHALPAGICGQDGQGKKDGVWCPLHRQLGTTNEQWREIEPRLLEFRKSARSVCEAINRTREELIDLLAAPNPDIEEIKGKREKILAGQRRMQELVINFLLNEKKYLTPDQQRTLFDLLRRRSGCAGQGPVMGPFGAGPACRSGTSGKTNCHIQRKRKEEAKPTEKME